MLCFFSILWGQGESTLWGGGNGSALLFILIFTLRYVSEKFLNGTKFHDFVMSENIFIKFYDCCLTISENVANVFKQRMSMKCILTEPFVDVDTLMRPYDPQVIYMRFSYTYFSLIVFLINM